MPSDFEHSIPREDEEQLKQIAGIKEDSPLSPAIKAAYFRRKKLANRINWNLSPGDLINVVLDVPDDVVAQTEDETRKASIVWLFKQRRVAHGDPVSYKFRKVKRTGKIIGITRDQQRAIIQDDESGDEREIPDADVEVPQLAAAV